MTAQSILNVKAKKRNNFKAELSGHRHQISANQGHVSSFFGKTYQTRSKQKKLTQDKI